MKVGLTLPQAADYGEGGSWAEIGGLARLADEGGADSLWVADHFLYRDEKVETGIHEAFTLLTAAAAVTTRVCRSGRSSRRRRSGRRACWRRSRPPSTSSRTAG